MSKRPIIREDKPLNLTGEQIERVLKGGLPVSLAYKDGKRRRIRKCLLAIGGGCECCGAWLEVWSSHHKTKVVSFPNGWSLILGQIKLRS